MGDEQHYLKSLCEIFSDQSTDFEKKIANALEKSLQLLHLDLGIISKIDTNLYTVLAYYPKEAPLTKGQSFELGATYCSLTLDANDVVAISHMGKSKHHGHPCYSTFALETYIGVPLIVDDMRYGTLNFSSLEPAQKDFSESDKEIVRLLGRWVSSLLERQKKDVELSDYHRQLEDIVEDRTSDLRTINKKLLEEIESKTKIEKILSEQKSFFKTLIETIPNPVFYKDLIGRYIGCNGAFEEFVGKSRSEIIGKTIYDLAPKDIADLNFEKDENLFKNPGTIHYEGTVRRSNGESRDVFFNKATLQGTDGLPTGIIGLITDITERKLLESQMRQAHKLEAIGTLAAGIAHDFNNVLSVILGFTDLALDSVGKQTQVEEDLREIYTAGLRAKDLVKQILTFARQSDEDIKPIQVAPIIKEVIKFTRSSIPTTIEIKHNIRSVSHIMGNATQIHQILMNLCTNAAHAMGSEGGVLELSLKDIGFDEIKDGEQWNLKFGEYIVIKVSDSGKGIDPEIVRKIFTPYFTTKGPGEGTGMGLALVHGIVESYGGKIDVGSTLGRGTVFTVYLPIAYSRKSNLVKTPEVLPTGQERILLVDDEVQIAEMTRRVLGQLGYAVTTKTSSIEALELFKSKQNDFDLVISDVTMPKMTGDQLARKLVQIRPNIPIILCTGYSKNLSTQEALSLGIKEYIIKPFLKEDLAETVRRVLDETKLKKK
jgi:PAS domain S-box-containing protein